nr:uncharacterized protein LOC128686490 [Cherax quadricarinatus]
MCKEGEESLRQESLRQESLRQVIEEFLPEVRFLTMTVDEVVEHVLPTKIFTPDEIIPILMSIKNMKNVSLPTGFSNNREKRYFDDSTLSSIRIQLGIACGIKHFQPGELSFLRKITFSEAIYLKKIVCHGSIFQNCNTLTIKNVAGHVIATTNVSGKEANFETPVSLASGTEFDFYSNYACNYRQTISSTFTSGSLTIKGTFVSGLGDATLFYWRLGN